jgi:hypothetical protein
MILMADHEFIIQCSPDLLARSQNDGFPGLCFFLYETPFFFCEFRSTFDPIRFDCTLPIQFCAKDTSVLSAVLSAHLDGPC